MIKQPRRNRFHYQDNRFVWRSVCYTLLISLLGGISPIAAMEIENDANRNADYVDYESFGAVGDGIADDLPAICKAHAHANKHALSVRSKPNATYHLGHQAITAIIATDTDWNTSKFIIDDTSVDNHKKSLFEVRSLLNSEPLKITRLKRDQKQLDVHPVRDCYLTVFDDNTKRYRRKGNNQNSGVAQSDCFILHRDGTIEGDIDWDYEDVTRVTVRPIDSDRLVLRGGVFTTIANRMKQETGYNYWSRNIKISRSNTEVIGLTHHVVGETEVGHPYSGFISVRDCANVTLRDCFATGHKTYQTIGSANKPVSMGSYDFQASSVVNFCMIGCTMDNILDRSLWGVIGTNHCKNILLEDCVLSRMDTHMGVSGTYTIRRCTLGHAGLNAIGRGRLTVEDSTLHGRSLISLRSDYGSTWEGDVVIRNCRWIPSGGRQTWPILMQVRNDSTHDFGYQCFMPTRVTIDGLFVDDSNVPANYQGMYLFDDPDRGREIPESKRSFPYTLTKEVVIQGLKTASGKAPVVSQNKRLRANVTVVP
ncbi:hypothetical protein [Novipirellula aureliae]|nr:hypothetical protein [Novipirellula aureliae]